MRITSVIEVLTENLLIKVAIYRDHKGYHIIAEFNGERSVLLEISLNEKWRFLKSDKFYSLVQNSDGKGVVTHRQRTDEPLPRTACGDLIVPQTTCKSCKHFDGNCSANIGTSCDLGVIVDPMDIPPQDLSCLVNLIGKSVWHI